MYENHTLSRFTNLLRFFYLPSHIMFFIKKSHIKTANAEADTKDTYRERASSNKTRTLSKSINMNIWVVGTSNQLFIRGS